MSPITSIGTPARPARKYQIGFQIKSIQQKMLLDDKMAEDLPCFNIFNSDNDDIWIFSAVSGIGASTAGAPPPPPPNCCIICCMRCCIVTKLPLDDAMSRVWLDLSHKGASFEFSPQRLRK